MDVGVLHSKNSISQLSTLLAGPILRRVEPSQVCIWIACSKPVTIRAEVFRTSDFGSIKSTKDTSNGWRISPIGVGTAESIRLGEQLHIGLVIVYPSRVDTNDELSQDVKPTFPTDELLAYDLEVTYDLNNLSDTKESKRLKDFGLLSGINSIVYEDNKHSNGIKHARLPNFFIRGDRKSPLNLLHGSCRKLHGKGEDCLIIADEMVRKSVTDLTKRPSVLFLTGDQIYADDVADVLIKYLTQFSINLVGWEEQINGSDKKLSDIPMGGRQQLIKDLAKFTSENARNHLLSFGEFAAMYLIAWNVENWPENYTTEFKKVDSQTDQKRVHLEIEQLEQARRAMPAIRRVLANVPTYMICDDHEITDDWNITREWVEQVRTSACGTQIIANGLAAYWAFQAWGNNPSLFDQNFVDVVSGYLGKSGEVTSSHSNAFQNYLWDFHGWTFDVPTIPPTLFLDCRTHRQFDSFRGPPRLIDDEELQTILHSTQRMNYGQGQPIILVSPTPVFGFDLAEELQEYLSSKSSIYKWDLETWSANEVGFTRFLSFLARDLQTQHCIFLSGDVHYGFTISATFTLLGKGDVYRKDKEKEDDDLTMNITQLNSSALKTTSLGKEILLNEILGNFRQLFVSKQSIRVGWNNMSSKARRLKQRDKNLRSVINDLKQWSNATVQDKWREYPTISPDWIESRSIHSTSSRCVSRLIIADNNLGLVSIYGDRHKILSHKLLVRKKKENTTKIWETITELGAW
jgi:hypothetical protein